MKIIPTPKVMQNIADGADVFAFAPSITNNSLFGKEIEAFVAYVKKLYAIDVASQENAAIDIVQEDNLAPEAYRITIVKDAVTIYASTGVGINHAFATVLQMMRIQEGKIVLPAITIEDAPDTPFRGMMVDLARDWHPFSYLKKYVDICYFYKISVLHLHFTDDQSYTLPSDIYPQLSTENQHYTKEQIKELVEYAYERGVELCPEIDVPGHCKSFGAAYGDIFGTKGVICMHEDSMEAMRNLFAELCDMFPCSKYIHIGGDEVYAMAEWTKCPQCLEYAKSVGIDADMEDKGQLAELLYTHFITEMASICMEKGKQPIVWEGFKKDVNDRISKEILVMSWENYYQITPDLLDAGFRVINCSWNPMYIVTPRTMWTPEEVFDWSIYQWQAIHPESPYRETKYHAPEDSCVIGGQLLAWGDWIVGDFPDVLEGVREECKCLVERIPMLAENTWNIKKVITYDEFEKSVEIQKGKIDKIIEA